MYLIKSLSLATLLTVVSLSTVLGQGGDREAGDRFASRSPVIGRHSMAATSHPLATQIAIDVLKDGGNAVDAAIAGNVALSLMEPHNCGPGGDLFAIVWDPKTKMLYGLNASGRSPKSLSLEEVKKGLDESKKIPKLSPLSVSVPGAVDGWRMLHERFGSRPLKELLQPAIEYAKEGVPLPQVIAGNFPQEVSDPEDYQPESFTNFYRTFMPDGKALKTGDVFRNPDLARTLEKIAEHGPRSFYEGEIADTIDAYMQRVGGHLRKSDFVAHRSNWVDPVSTAYRGHEVYELPPNGQGIAVLQMLNILEGYDLAKMEHNSADYLHVQIEAKKLAFADRARYYADPSFSEIPTETLISKPYAQQRRALIDTMSSRESVDAGNIQLTSGDTIYLTVADESGMMVSLIQSIFHGFGSRLVPDGLGFPLQNRGLLFSFEEGHPNIYAPGKRPFHTIIPSFVMKDGEPFISFGVVGGAMQPQGQVQVICNIVDFGMNVQEAGDAIRYRHVGSSQPTGDVMTDGGTVQLESGIDAKVVEALKARGHNIVVGEGSFGGYQGIQWDPIRMTFHGASEMRKDGQASGY